MRRGIVVRYPFPLYHVHRSTSPRRSWHTAHLLPDTLYLKQGHGRFVRVVPKDKDEAIKQLELKRRAYRYARGH